MGGVEENTRLRGYRELVAWQTAMDLVEFVYVATRNWPKEELYSLTSQVRRAVVSVPSNIAEGQARALSKEFLYHLRIAYGSLSELETQIIVAQRLGYISHEVVERILAQSAEVSRLINGLSRSLLNRQIDD
jgi:four helix bundle protein